MIKKILIGNERGYALAMAILMLAILMISGVLVSNTTVTDLQTVRNTAMQAQHVAAAESAAMAAVQTIENESDPVELDVNSTTKDWLTNYDISDADYDEDGYKWGLLPKTALPKTTGRLKSTDADVLKYRMVGWDAARGTSLGAYEATLKEGKIRGVYVSSEGIYSVELGFKKRF
ncbi:hypothetical protein [Desulforegula conservatrix]|uniref:hypothetical protein n=1 Tax=Desulforegula conservatrix TaxID=153026 RepID=UPI000488777B|nr:hypothetical protein [Desulforegula conservatrix]